MKKNFFVFSKPMEKFYNISKTVNVFSKNLDGTYIDANDCMAEVVGLPASSVKGKTDFDLSWFDTAPELRRHDKLVQSENKLRLFFEEPVFQDKPSIRYLNVKAPLKDSSNHIVGMFGMAYRLEKMSLSTIINRINSSGIIPIKPLFIRQFDTMCRKYFLSPPEKEYLYFIVRGMPMREIGKVFNVPLNMVSTYFDGIKNKFDCHSKREIISKILDSELE